MSFSLLNSKTKALYRTADYFAIAGGLVLLAIVLVTTINAAAFILDRFSELTGMPIAGLPGYEDFVRLSISAAALMFFPLCQVRYGHISVDLFIGRAPDWFQNFLRRLWLICAVIAAAFFAGWMIVGLFEKMDDAVVTGVLGWPEWPFYIPGIISLVLWGLIATAQIVRGEQDA